MSEHLANIVSDDEDEDDDDDDGDTDEDDNNQLNSPNSNIRGYHGKIMDRSRMKYERKLQTKEEKENQQEDVSTNVTNGDLVVEDIDEINHLFVKENESSTADKSSKTSTTDKSSKPLKKKKRKRKNKKRTHRHLKPKLNHWEILAVDQSKQEVCGCRHHVRRLEADHIVYDWCRCKDHLHKDIKEKSKSIPPPPPPPPPSPPPPTPPPKRPKKIKPKVEKKTIGINATEKTTTELALAYDPSTVDYDVIEEVLYYRTSSGRLVKFFLSSFFFY